MGQGIREATLYSSVLVRQDAAVLIVMNERGRAGDVRASLEAQVRSLGGPCVVIPIKEIVAEVRGMLYGGTR